MGILDFFGFGKRKKKVEEFLNRGAIVVDVRTQFEFSGGHVKGSLNVPLDSLHHKTAKLKKLNKPLILCCASGNRSGTAAVMLRSHGIECMNGGGWRSLA